MDNHAAYRSYVVGIFLTAVVGIFCSWFVSAIHPGIWCFCIDIFIPLLIIAWITKDTEKTFVFTYVFCVSSKSFSFSTFDLYDFVLTFVVIYPLILFLSYLFFWGYLTEDYFSREECTKIRGKPILDSKNYKSVVYSIKKSKKKYVIFLGILLLSIFFIATIIINGSKELHISSSSLSNLVLQVWNFLWQFKLQIGFIVYILDIVYNTWAYLEARKRGLQISRIKTILLILGSLPLFINLIPPKKP